MLAGGWGGTGGSAVLAGAGRTLAHQAWLTESALAIAADPGADGGLVTDHDPGAGAGSKDERAHSEAVERSVRR